MRTFWRTMAALRLALGLAPERLWQRGLKAGGFPESAITTWVAAELSRGNSVDIAEAGRELGRYDSTAWIAGLDAPGAVIVTTQDTAVPPSKQRALAAAMRAPVVRGPRRPRRGHRPGGRVQRQLLAALDARARPAGRRDPLMEGLVARRRRRRPLRLGRLHARLPRLPRRRMGPPRRRRRPAVREALPRGLPVRPVVADDPAQARELPRRVRRLRLRRTVAALRRRRRRAPAPGRRHHPPPRQDRGDDQQRPARRRDGRGRGLARPLRLGL